MLRYPCSKSLSDALNLHLIERYPALPRHISFMVPPSLSATRRSRDDSVDQRRRNSDRKLLQPEYYGLDRRSSSYERSRQGSDDKRKHCKRSESISPGSRSRLCSDKHDRPEAFSHTRKPSHNAGQPGERRPDDAGRHHRYQGERRLKSERLYI